MFQTTTTAHQFRPPRHGTEIFSFSSHTGKFSKSQTASDIQRIHQRSLQCPSTSLRDSCDYSDVLDPRKQPPTDQIDVSSSALHQSSRKGTLFSTHGLEVRASLALGKMEDFVSPLDGSDGNLSPTQENDPSVYIRLQELMAHQSHVATGTTQDQDPSISNESLATAQDTGLSYAVNDTGHLTLDYQPQPPILLHESFDEAEVGDVSSGGSKSPVFDEEVLDPYTPAQGRLAIDRPGTVMGLTQLFAETQSSPRSRDRHLPPSSSRPSPDILNQYQSPKHIISSPLTRRVIEIQPENAAIFNNSSSPGLLQLENDANQTLTNRQPLSERPDFLTNTKRETYPTRLAVYQNFPGPFEVYTPRKESQERRLQQAKAVDDGSQSSDDGFSDGEAEINRRARRKKDEAARELAIIGTSKPRSGENDMVEVPSTNTGRRRGVAEDYEAQCTGFDARDTQQDTTIADSQSTPVPLTVSNSEDSPMNSEDELSQSRLQDPPRQHRSEEDSALSGELNSPEQLPSLKLKLTWPLSEVSSNIAELRTPAMHKKIPYVDGESVPETSPSEPHLERYGEIVSKTPPVPSEEAEDIYNPFSQDIEYNNLVQSPPPRRRNILRIAKPLALTSDGRIETNTKTIQESRTNESPVTSANPLFVDHHGKAETALIPTAATSEVVSEYVTAPTGPVAESHNQPWMHSDIDARTTARCLNGTTLDEVAAQSSRNNQNQSRMSGLEVGGSEVEQPLVSLDVVGRPPPAPTCLPHDGANNSPYSRQDVTSRTPAEISELDHTEAKAAKKLQDSSQRSKRSVRQSKAGATVNITPAGLAAEPSEVLPNRLRSATQLRGSSRALRRLLEDDNRSINSPASTHVTPTPTIQKVTRSSRLSSTNPSEKALSVEPETTITPGLSTRRRALSNQLVDPGLFNTMAFSVTYSASREDEKQQVLSLIRKNGGRVLEKGFDELFDISTLQGTSVARNNEAGSISSGYNLTLSATAREIGFACVIADEHSRRVKFMQALALGIPCISGLWIEHCLAKKEIIDWDQYHLAAGESSFLGGAIRSRNLKPYPAKTSNFAERFDLRPKLLKGRSVLLITGKGRAEERRKPYFFLTQALGARRVKHVQNNQEARRFLIEAESHEEEWDWVYVDDNENEAEKAIFGPAHAPARKRKRGSEIFDDNEGSTAPPKKVRIVSDEYVIQSLILGKFLE